MNLYILIWNFQIGGAQKFVVKLANAYVKRGVPVTMLVSNPQGVFKALLDERVRVKQFQIPKTNNPFRLWVFYNREMKFIEKDSMIVVNGPNNFRQLSRLNFLLAKWNIIFRLHNDIEITKSTFSVLKSLEMRLLFNQKRVRLLAMSDKQCDKHKELYKLKTIQHIPNFFPEMPFNDSQKPEGEVRAICLARFSPEKGYQVLIPALGRKNQRLQVDIYGEGPLKEELIQKARELKLENVNFYDPVVDVNTLLPKYHFLIMPSTYETFGNVIIEAFRHGLPVVSTDCDGPLNFVIEGINGFLVKKGDIDSLAQKIDKMCEAINSNSFDNTAIRTSISEIYSEDYVIGRYNQLFV